MSSGAYSTSMQFNGHKNHEMEQFVGPSIAEGRMNTDFTELMLKSDEKRFEPGRFFNYSNFDTIALGLLVQAATGMPLTQYEPVAVVQLGLLWVDMHYLSIENRNDVANGKRRTDM